MILVSLVSPKYTAYFNSCIRACSFWSVKVMMISCYVLTRDALLIAGCWILTVIIFRSEFLLKPKLHQEHSSVADTFNFDFLDISASLDRWVLSAMSCIYFVDKIIWSFTENATVHFLQVLMHLLRLIPWRRILPQNIYIQLVFLRKTSCLYMFCGRSRLG